MKIHQHIYFLFLVWSLAGCKSSKVQVAEQLNPMPSAISGRSDSSNSGRLNWKQFFSDPNLVALLDEGIKNNLDVSMALQRLEAARANVHLAKGEMLPTIGANAAYWQRKFGYYTMDDAGNRTTEIRPGEMVPTHLPDYFVGLQTAWEIDIWGKLKNRKKAAVSRYLAGVEGKNLVVTNLVANLANAYYELLMLDNALDAIRETITIREKAVELVILQKQASAANELAVKQFKAQLLNSQAMEYETLQLITETENYINILLGRYPQSITRNKTEFDKPIPVKPAVGIPSDLLKNRPDIRQAEFELMASKADVKAAQAAFYPSLNITGLAGFQSFRAGLLFQTPGSIAYSVLGNLAAPLINRSAIKSAFRSANAAQQEALYHYQKSILDGYVEVYNEVVRINNLEKIADLKAKEVEVFSQSIETANDLFRTSRANYIEVLMTQRDALESRFELLETKKRQYKAVIDIYKALGGGWQ